MKTKRIMRLMSMTLVAIVSLGFLSCSSDDDDFEGDYYYVETPENVRGTEVNGKVTVTWDAVDGATSYKVFRSADGSSFSQLGTSSKNSFTDNSPLPGTNYYRVQALGANDAQSWMSATVQIIVSDAQGKSGIYLGLIGFNQKLKHYPIRLLTGESKQGYYDFIDAFSSDNDGTALYYAVDQAISTLRGKSYPADLSRVYVVTFTDGIDNYSLELYNEKFSTSDACGDYVKSRLKTEKVSGVDVMGYAVGLKHGDVNSQRFNATLNRIASSDSLVTTREDMSAVEAEFKNIAKNITEVRKTQNITVSISGGLNDGERIRFTFDLSASSTSATSSNLYVEGIYRRATRKLTNITAKGLTLKGTEVVGAKNDKTGLIDFTFTEVVAANNKLIDNKKALEWWGNPWQKDTEFTPDVNTKTEVLSHSAAIILVLDCTKSLGQEKFKKMQTSAKSFIATLLDQTYNETPNDDPSDDPSDDSDYNGHEYVDLGLPSGIKWATCNIGASSPSDYGTYYAWGEIKAKGAYTSSNSATYGKSFTDIAGDSQYDAARANWGGNWRLPSDAECAELRDLCTWQWTTQDGHRGYEVTGPNGSSIFLPAAGYRNGSSLSSAESIGNYWSSTPRESSSWSAYSLGFGVGYPSVNGSNRYYGKSVRPVSD